jgi:hypothetical protein
MRLLARAARGTFAIGLLMLVLVGLTACNASGEETTTRPVTPLSQRLDRVEVGMTWDEAMKALELAPNDLSVPAEGTCRWEDSGGVAHITFENDRVVSKSWTGWP